MVLATIGLAVAGLIGTTLVMGFLAGQIQNLFAFILGHTGTIFVFGSMVSALLVAVKNGLSSTPNWKQDVKYGGAIIGVFGLILFVGPALAGQLQGKQATATIKVSNPALDKPNIAGVNIHNFQNPSLVDQFQFKGLSFFGTQDNIEGTLTIGCESLKKDIEKTFSMTVTEETTNSVDLMLTGLPPNDKCIAEVMIENQAGKTSKTQTTFTVEG